MKPTVRQANLSREATKLVQRMSEEDTGDRDAIRRAYVDACNHGRGYIRSRKTERGLTFEHVPMPDTKEYG